MPEWITKYLGLYLHQDLKQEKSLKDMIIDEVRKTYKESKEKTAEKLKNLMPKKGKHPNLKEPKETNQRHYGADQQLTEMQKKGYRIELFYIDVNNLQIATMRIQERVKRGEHHMSPDEVFAR